MLTIAKEATDRATVAQEAEAKELQSLLNNYANLESNLSNEINKGTLLQEEKVQLEAKIAKMLTIAKEATDKASIEHEAEAKEFQSLLGNYKNLEANLSSEIEKENLLEEEKVQLEAKIAKMLTIAKEATDKATLHQKSESKELQLLLENYSNLESNLTSEINKGTILQEEKLQLEAKIAKMLTIAKKATEKGTIEYEADTKAFELLSSQYKSLESNLSHAVEQENLLKEEKSQLETKIENMLVIAKEGTDRATIEQKAKTKEFESLLGDYKNLEANLSSSAKKENLLKEENSKLETKIAEMLTMVKEATGKVTAVKEAEAIKIQTLLGDYKNLEANLSNQIEKANTLKKEKAQLETKIENMLVIAKEATDRATLEQEDKTKEFESLLGDYKNLEANLSSSAKKENLLKEENSKLETKIAEMLTMVKEATGKVTAVKEAEAIKIQTLLGDYKNLEANLSSSVEKENLLNEENAKLEAKISEMMNQIKEATAKATKAESKKIEQLTAEYKSLEANLSNQIEKTNTLKEEKVQLEAKNSEIIALKKEVIAKATKESETTAKTLEELSLMQKNLEGNLSSEVAKGSLLTQENQVLEAKLADMLKTTKESMAKAQAQAKIKEEAEAKTKAQLEQLIQEKTKAEKLAEQNALQLKKEQSATATALLAVQEAKSKLDTLAKEKAEIEKLAEEKAEAHRIAQEKAEKERIAQEEAKAKKEAEEKIKAEAEAEKMAKEKSASQQVAKEKLLSAFSLTQVEFKINSMELTNDSKELLNTTAKVMKEYTDFHYQIQGHTDSRGKEEFNIKLSKNRAEQVKQYLVSQGVHEELLSTEGMGSSQPIADNETKEGRFKNRRVVFKIIE